MRGKNSGARHTRLGWAWRAAEGRERTKGKGELGEEKRAETRARLLVDSSSETFSVVSSEDAGDAPIGRPILVGSIPGDKMARYQESTANEGEWGD